MKALLRTGVAALVFLCTTGSGLPQFSPAAMPPGARGGGVLPQGNTAAEGNKPNPAELAQEADELAELASQMPAKIGDVNQGILPKDIGAKLKRIEKIAKHLRSEIAP